MHTPEQSQLGKTSAYADQYDPSLLFPLPRQPKRDEIGIQDKLPFLVPTCGRPSSCPGSTSVANPKWR